MLMARDHRVLVPACFLAAVVHVVAVDVCDVGAVAAVAGGIDVLVLLSSLVLVFLKLLLLLLLPLLLLMLVVLLLMLLCRSYWCVVVDVGVLLSLVLFFVRTFLWSRW